jgi:hypothetical protein
MGYETDTYTLIPAGTVCSAGLTTAPAANQFSGSDFVRGVLRVNITAQAGTWTTTGQVAILLQNSPDGGTTWYPNAAAIGAAGYPATIAPLGYSALFTAGTTPVVALYSVIVNTFPGNLFRAAVNVVTGTSVTLGITGDFQKWLADNS